MSSKSVHQRVPGLPSAGEGKVFVMLSLFVFLVCLAGPGYLGSPKQGCSGRRWVSKEEEAGDGVPPHLPLLALCLQGCKQTGPLQGKGGLVCPAALQSPMHLGLPTKTPVASSQQPAASSQQSVRGRGRGGAMHSLAHGTASLSCLLCFSPSPLLHAFYKLRTTHLQSECLHGAC
jgi:hypothetical protein